MTGFASRLPESLTREEFFNGISIPRNKELMRIYRDVELVESLGLAFHVSYVLTEKIASSLRTTLSA